MKTTDTRTQIAIALKNTRDCAEREAAEADANRKPPMKATDNMYDTPYGKKRESLIIEALNAHSVLPEIRAQRDALQTELGNTQFALEEMAAQRDAAVAALRATLDALCNETSEAVDSYWINNVKDKARAVIAAAESEGQ